MKVKYMILLLAVGLMVMSASLESYGQTRDSRYNGERTRDDRRRDGNDRQADVQNDWDNSRSNNHQSYDSYSQNRRFHSNNGNHYGWQNGRRMNYHYDRPRYIYFRDYDVYYDCHNNSYISHTGRRWVVTNAPPRVYQNVNWSRTRGYEVDYWDDDFHVFLERRRPAIGRECHGW